MREIDNILAKNERIKWEGKPAFLPYILNYILICVFFSSFIGIGIIARYYIIKNQPAGFNVILSVTNIWIICISAILLFSFIHYLLNYKHIHYRITNKRVLWQGGIIGRDFLSIDLKSITNVKVMIGLADRIAGKGTGRIILYTGATEPELMLYPLQNLQNPYDVSKILNDLSS